MTEVPQPDDEAERLAALARYDILDSPPEPGFDAIADLARDLLGAPAAAIAFVAAERAWVKARSGIDAAQCPRAVAFCAHTILADEIMVVEDATLDPRFRANPFVIAGKVRFYVGAPLRTPDGHRIGGLCVVDSEPRGIGAREKRQVAALARVVAHQLELRRAAARPASAADADAATGARWLWEVDEALRFTSFGGGRGAARAWRALEGRSIWNLRRTDQAALRAAEFLLPYVEGRQAFADVAFPLSSRSGRTRWFTVDGRPVLDENGAWRGYRGTARDVTDEQGAREADAEPSPGVAGPGRAGKT